MLLYEHLNTITYAVVNIAGQQCYGLMATAGGDLGDTPYTLD